MKEINSICTPDGWTLPGSCYVASRNETLISQPEVDVLKERCRRVLSNAEGVMRLIDSELKPKVIMNNNPTYSFMVIEDGFIDFNKNNVPALIEQDPETQIDIYGLFWFNKYYSRLFEEDPEPQIDIY